MKKPEFQSIFRVLIIGFRFLVLLCGLCVFKLAHEIVVCAESLVQAPWRWFNYAVWVDLKSESLFYIDWETG